VILVVRLDSMHISRSKRFWMASGLLLLGVVGVSVSLLLQSEPNYEGRPLSYWLGRLEATVISPAHSLDHGPNHQFRNQAAAITWIARSAEMHQRSAQVLRHAGPECLPVLFARLTAKPRPPRRPFLREWAYALRLTDFGPMPGQDYGEVRRGQALTAILLLDKHAAPLVPQLAALAAEDNDDAVHRAASYALYEIAPKEFRRVRSPGKTGPGAEPGRAANRSQPVRPETNGASAAAGTGR